MIDNCLNIAIVRFIAVGAYGGTPGRNALRPYGHGIEVIVNNASTT